MVAKWRHTDSMNDHQRAIEQHALSLGLDLQVNCSGSPSSRICILAEYPGATEVQLKQPLVGASGRYLWTELGKIGVRREQCYITNVFKRKAEEGKTGVKVPAEEVRRWEAVLAKELSALSNVRFILCMGNA